MGIAAYNRGSLAISRQICTEGGCPGCVRCSEIKATPRPSTWGDKARAKALARAHRLIASNVKYGLPRLTVDMLAVILRERERVGEATAKSVAEEALAPHS